MLTTLMTMMIRVGTYTSVAASRSMTGSASDVAEFRPHVRSKQRRERLAARFKDPADPLKIDVREIYGSMSTCTRSTSTSRCAVTT